MGLLQNDVRRKLVGDLLLKHNLSLLNDGFYTYLHPTTGSSSAVDLSIATQSLYLDFSWQVVEVTDFRDIANTIAQAFSNNSSSENYSSKFQSFCRQAENQQLKFKSSNYENYNNPFSLDELIDGISKSHDTAVGPDDVHFQMLMLCSLYSTFLITSGFGKIPYKLVYFYSYTST